jgi:hypothetical protein
MGRGSLRAWMLCLLALVAAARTRGSAGELEGAPPPAAAEPHQVIVDVDESGDSVRLRFPQEADIDPGSVQVLLAGRAVTILARTGAGRRVRSPHLRVASPLTEEGATADYDADGSLTVTLRKQLPAEPAHDADAGQGASPDIGADAPPEAKPDAAPGE